jgi:hypothetical protein
MRVVVSVVITFLFKYVSTFYIFSLPHVSMRQESVFLYLGSCEKPQCGKQHKEIYKHIKRGFLLLRATFPII